MPDHVRRADDRLALASIINATVPLIVIVIAPMFLYDETITCRIAGLAIGFAGSSCWSRRTSWTSQDGYLPRRARADRLESVCYTVGNVYASATCTACGPMIPAVFQVFFGLLIIVPSRCVVDRRWPWRRRPRRSSRGLARAARFRPRLPVLLPDPRSTGARPGPRWSPTSCRSSASGSGALVLDDPIRVNTLDRDGPRHRRHRARQQRGGLPPGRRRTGGPHDARAASAARSPVRQPVEGDRRHEPGRAEDDALAGSRTRPRIRSSRRRPSRTGIESPATTNSGPADATVGIPPGRRPPRSRTRRAARDRSPGATARRRATSVLRRRTPARRRRPR